MNSTQDKQARLVNALISANGEKKIQWGVYDGEDGCVVAEVGDKMIYINDHKKGNVDSIKIEIYYNGDLAESFVDDDLYDTNVTPIGSDGWYTTMLKLLQNCRRIASKSDEVLDSLLKDLE